MNLKSSSLFLSRRVRGFQRFFEMDQEESTSPFLSEEGKRLSKNLPLKTSLCAAFLLFFTFCLRFFGYDSFVPFFLSIVYLLVGSSALSSAIEDLFIKKDVNIDVLMTIAAFGALAMGSPMEGGLLLVLYELSSSLEDLVTYKAKKSLLALGEMNPEKALCIIEDGSFLEKSLQDIDVGQVVVVRSGEIVPIDGLVVRLQAQCSLAHLTGEETPVFFSVGAKVPSGAKVIEGSLHIQTEVKASDSTLSKLIQLITRARSHKPALAKAFDVWGRWYSISVILLSGGIFLLFPFFSSLSFFGETGSISRAITFLITASPCALILAVPISYVSALGSLVRQGAILKGGIILDRLNRCGAIAFDKTGTLTQGSFQVVQFKKLEGLLSEQEALSLFASLEQYAVHPLAQAVVAYAKQQKVPLLSCRDVSVEAGKGLSGMVDLNKDSIFVAAGSRSYMKDPVPQVSLLGASEIFVSFETKGLFVCYLKDTLRQESKPAIQALQKLKKRVVLISGDKDVNVQSIASELGVLEVVSEASPEDKVTQVSSLLKEGLVMVGDGLNDAPALAEATVGISMGTLSSASAREASDVILLRDNLLLIPLLFKKAITTRRVIRQNLFLSLSALLAGTILALGGAITLWCAVLLHEGSTLLVGLNGLRLLQAKSTN